MSSSSNQKKRTIVSVDGAHYLDKPVIRALKTMFPNTQVKRDQVIPHPTIVLFSLFGGKNSKMIQNCNSRILLCGEPDSTNKKQYHIIVDCKLIPNKRRNDAVLVYFPFYAWSFSERFQNNPEDLLHTFSEQTSETLRKKNFCAFLYRNNVQHRNDFFHQLSKTYKQVDALGKSCNSNPNQSTDRTVYKPGKITYNDLAVQKYKNYKFVIAIENTVGLQGYITEKIINPMLAGAIPIYWGAPDVVQHFNEKSFININRLGVEGAIREIERLDKDDKAYNEMLQQNWFKKNELPIYFESNYMETEMRRAFREKNHKKQSK